MKKTLTVNLGGTVYHIDEDAYILLDNYLNNLRYHFRKEEGADEIVRDMEARIAELFDEALRGGLQVITIKEVEEVIARMGKPEELNDGEEENASTSGEKAYDSESTGTSRRLFRNPDDRVLGGVVSGLAAYFGWDVTWTRIVFILVGFLIHGLILAYLLAWIIIPLAQTATEKLQMRGEPINVENIGRTVTDGFEKVNDYVHSEKPRSALHKLGNGVVAVFGFLLKLCLVLLLICCAPFLLVGLVVLFALLMAATGMIVSLPTFIYNIIPWVDWSSVHAIPGVIVGLTVCGLLVVGIPIAGLIQAVMQSFGSWKPMGTSAKVVLVLLWMVALAIGIVLIFQVPFLTEPLLTTPFWGEFL
ncbi:PspC domain-containing protein [uncultured Bacteroides sp.]|uniref:PspC domain-containing protein n=1 Tax=uncultured Bacteroides sp. TaxID=162156 RepID=UPI00280AF958|nr:PspC domain-containing protein [uncultured Bacteroides sp.]